MTPDAFYASVITPGAALVPTSMNTLASRVLLFAIAGQESAWSSRVQIPGGQARGYWQCERGGAVKAVLGDSGTGPIARRFCAEHDIPSDLGTVWEAIAWHDGLAYLIARLALWQQPAPLPALENCDGAWTYYLDTWRPGAPRPHSWPGIHAQACTICR